MIPRSWKSSFGGIAQASPSWTPITPGTPALWLDATTGITLVAGSKVSAWMCQATGQSVTQATDASRPVFSATAWNGTTAGVNFGSGFTALTTNTAIASILNGSNLFVTVLMTVNVTAAGTTQYLVEWYIASDHSGFDYYVNSSGKDVVDFTSGGSPQTGSLTVTGANKRLAAIRSFSTGSADDVIDTYSNAVSSLHAPAGATISVTDFIIGANGVLGISPATMTLKELVIYAAALSSDDVMNYQNYSVNRWGA